MNGMPQCFAAYSPTGSTRQVDERTTFAPVRSSSLQRRASSLLSTMYGNFRGFGVVLQFSTPSISRKITFISQLRTTRESPSAVEQASCSSFRRGLMNFLFDPIQHRIRSYIPLDLLQFAFDLRSHADLFGHVGKKSSDLCQFMLREEADLQ